MTKICKLLLTYTVFLMVPVYGLQQRKAADLIKGGDLIELRGILGESPEELNKNMLLQHAVTMACPESHLIVDELLKYKDVEVNVCDIDGNTLLLQALMIPRTKCKFQEVSKREKAANPQAVRKKIVEILIKRGAPVNIHNKLGQTPLMIAAASWADEAIVDLLIKNGARLDSRDSQGRTPLMYAVNKLEAYRDTGIIQLLLECGGKNIVNVSDKQGFSPLAHAVIGLDVASVHFLLEHDADFFALDSLGKDIASVHKYLEGKNLSWINPPVVKKEEQQERLRAIQELVIKRKKQLRAMACEPFKTQTDKELHEQMKSGEPDQANPGSYVAIPEHVRGILADYLFSAQEPETPKH